MKKAILGTIIAIAFLAIAGCSQQKTSATVTSNIPTSEPTATNTPTPEPTATNTPTPKPTATNTPTPTPETLPYIKDGTIYMDVRENPECMESPLLVLGNLQGDDEYKKAYRLMIKYGNYMPIIGEITTYDPLQRAFGVDKLFTVPLYYGGTFFIHHNEEAEERLCFNLATALGSSFPDNKGGFCGSCTDNDDIPYEYGANYVCDLTLDGEITFVIKYYVYYID